MWKWLKGKKSYLVAFGAAASAVGAYASGQISVVELVAALFSAAGLASVRNAVTTEATKAREE